MIQVEFSVHDQAPVGFCINGHAGAGSAGRDIVCAAVSSAAYMAANTLTDVVGAQPDIALADGLLRVSVPVAERPKCDVILRGLMMHLTQLAGQYPKNIHITYTEV